MFTVTVKLQELLLRVAGLTLEKAAKVCRAYEQSTKQVKEFKRGFQVVVPVPRIVSVASNFWKQQGRAYGNALAITQDDPCDRSDQSSEIDSSSILATETTGNESQVIAYFKWEPGSSDRSVGTYPMMPVFFTV